MVVDDFDLDWTVLNPGKTNSVLLVYPDRVLAFAVAAEEFEVVSWRYSQVIEGFGCVELD